MVDSKVRRTMQSTLPASTTSFESLLAKIETREAVISVIGLGYVGLPLAVMFAESGYRVVGIDVNNRTVDAINQGKSHIEDIPSEKLSGLTHNFQDPWSRPSPHNGARHRGGLSATTDYDALNKADVAIVCVPTPLSKTHDPDVSYIVSTVEEISRRLRPGMLIVLESTSYPGTTEELILPSLQGSNGRSFSAGVDFFLAFSPERIDPGRKDWTIKNTPKVIGGVTPHCTNLAKALYECGIQQMVPVSSPKVAEMVKLLENTFRATNIALVNEVAIMCDRLGIDVWEVIDAAKTKPFGYMPFYPGPGLGGHCIPIDPQYLAWKLKTLNYNARFIQLAEEINFGMPTYVLAKIVDALNDDRKALKGSRVLVLGVAYKEGVSDVRESPALELIHLLSQKGATVKYHDPYVPKLDLQGKSMISVTLSEQELSRADCVVVTTAHEDYDWQFIVDSSQLMVDTRNATKDVSKGLSRVVKL